MPEETQSELKLGGETLDKSLRQAAFGKPDDRVDLFKRLVSVDLIVPVEKMPGQIDPGVAFPVPLVTNAKGSIGFPLFSNPQRLKEYAALAGWTHGEEEPPYLGMNAQSAMEMATSTEASVAVLDPGGPIPLIISRDEAETLIQGKIPGFVEEPPPAPPPPPLAPPAPPPPPQAVVPEPVPDPARKPQPIPTAPLSRFTPPSVVIPPKVISVFKVLMEQFHMVRLAVFFEHSAEKKIYLGLALRSEEAQATQILKSSKDALNRVMKAETAIEVITLTPEGEVEVLRTCTPFYTR